MTTLPHTWHLSLDSHSLVDATLLSASTWESEVFLMKGLDEELGNETKENNDLYGNVVPLVKPIKGTSVMSNGQFVLSSDKVVRRLTTLPYTQHLQVSLGCHSLVEVTLSLSRQPELSYGEERCLSYHLSGRKSCEMMKNPRGAESWIVGCPITY
ncbi:hypothetical protein L873DRAFT_1787889 [Choiromyces venosus 120613-1]|uniref:Uncharacterized protein n=1 Tax=Choiromyces venosus 120613-1 TaxID=1336337 RepID=A0A3N4K898_9PEZI|nr:hypothetical protein L873DRAFT_1787889 [Choiromyces venosus 120613-1]